MKFSFITILIVCFAAAGCARQSQPVTANANTVVSDGLAVNIELDKTALVVGEAVMVKLTARNMTDQPIRIVSPTRSPHVIRVWRNTGLAWDKVKAYPEAAMMVVSPWTLDAGADRTFFVRVPVEPDWPTAELLRLTGEFNGRPDAAPGVAITVSRPGETKE